MSVVPYLARRHRRSTGPQSTQHLHRADVTEGKAGTNDAQQLGRHLGGVWEEISQFNFGDS